jgi:UvrB/UvrC motif-containing protein
MSDSEHIDSILKSWPYEPSTLSVRIRKGDDGREVLQMRLDLGLLQLETTGRPDRTRPGGKETYLDYLLDLESRWEPADASVDEVTDEEEAGEVGDEVTAAIPDFSPEPEVEPASGFTMDEEQCREADREFVQYYHRRLCWLAMREFAKAMHDADHTLRLMDFCRDHSPDEEWTMSHEQYRPFVLFHRTQAAALAQLESSNGAEASVEAINAGLESIKEVFVEHEAEEEYEADELVARLVEMREGLRKQFDVGSTLEEQLRDAVANEKYELAARLRDELAQRRGH